MKAFHHLLGNNLVASITNFTVWFAITFWIILQTRSVFATGMIAGIYLVFTAGFGLWFGSLVDHHLKKTVMLGSSLASAVFYVLALGFLLISPAEVFKNPYGYQLWIFVLLTMLGVIAGNIRAIALPTVVTLLVPEDRRDKANGLVGMVGGLGFLVTSGISGLLVAKGGMAGTLVFALAFTTLAFAHLMSVKVGETRAEMPLGEPEAPRRIDIKGTIAVVAAVPGLFALIFFATFNNFLGGIFMALLDAYGMSMVNEVVWGFTFMVVSTGFIISGLLISRVGLGRKPLRTLLTVNLIAWVTCCVFTLQQSFWLLAAGCFVWMLVSPWAEAAEQTTLQKVVPLERQGRVFGFAQSLEQSASPITAFLFGPLTQFVFIPFMTDGWGAQTIGDWFGTGPARGTALVFTLAGIIGVIVTVLAFRSKSYRNLSAAYAKAPSDGAAPAR
ncbi:MFS transporter [Asticcacaulis sp. AC402]|uniref:MFS transporter n=1 Tax=Asticcacaulis sp. AC402 TaxID=1282361 RepID=UPI0003C3DD9A|nr:MFS transporter [Asticcacaulis sp. AC402]ESQ77623.1 multidrug transporter [Asticcacaulis sp. AC402]